MLKYISTALLCCTLAMGCAAHSPRDAVPRIDATTAESAEASYKEMLRGRSAAEAEKLALSVLVLNMEGVRSAHEVAANSGLQAPSIGRIRGKVAGMTAEEIIALAAKNPSVRLEVPKP